MQIEVIPQIELGNVRRLRVGDYLNTHISGDGFDNFQFAVAYMRVSGLDRIAGSLDTLLNKGGCISGSIGIDDGVTSYEALEILTHYSSNSTVFHTLSDFVFHPKLYLISGENGAIVLIGSPNLTRDGLYRNVEIATSVILDFEESTDYEVYTRYAKVINEFLNVEHPNVQPLNLALLDQLRSAGAIKLESDTRDPGTSLSTASRAGNKTALLTETFPMLRVPTAPPGSGLAVPKTSKWKAKQHNLIAPPPPITENTSTFIMQLSEFDSSHRSGVKGTPEILIPLDAQQFFPQIVLKDGRRHPDANFDVVLNTPIGQERHSYRVWYYEGKREFRLRMNKQTIDLSSPEGGDLIVINRLTEDHDPAYEVTILSQHDPTFPAFLAKCVNTAGPKRWGFVIG